MVAYYRLLKYITSTKLTLIIYYAIYKLGFFYFGCNEANLLLDEFLSNKTPDKANYL